MEISRLRELTELEKKFVKEAVAGYFQVYYEADGTPVAVGANGTGNLFSMEIEELATESEYRLVKEEY